MSENSSIQLSVLEDLLRERPKFHGELRAGERNYNINLDVLRWIFQSIPEKSTTLETGCGYTTVALASLNCQHTVISPFAKEHTLIQDWCREHSVDTSQVDFRAEASQKVLPQLELSDLDFVIVDGDHAFPAPLIDWYYTAEGIREGGYLLVDDTQITTGRILRDFLAMEEGRWKLHKQIADTSIFQKTTGARVVEGINWVHQPYCQLSLYARAKKLPRKMGGIVIRRVKAMLPNSSSSS